MCDRKTKGSEEGKQKITLDSRRQAGLHGMLKEKRAQDNWSKTSSLKHRYGSSHEQENEQVQQQAILPEQATLDQAKTQNTVCTGTDCPERLRDVHPWNVKIPLDNILSNTI